MRIELTVADHVQNGFVALAAWRAADEQEARTAIAAIDALVDPEAEPNDLTCDYSFILDLHADDSRMECIGNGERSLPLQIAMRLAPDQVSAWLKDRPEPDNVIHFDPPVLAGLPK